MNEFMQAFQSGEDAYKSVLREGIALGKRESAAKLAEKDAAIAELVEALREIQDDCETVARDESITVAERRTWRVIAHKCNNAATKHAPILPNLHSHHGRAEMLRDEYPDKYAGLKADAIRENGDTK